MNVRGYKFIIVLLAIAMPILACSGSGATQEPQYANEYERLQALNGTGDDGELDVDDSAFVIAMSYVATLEGIRAAANSAPGTFVMAKGDFMVFVWPAGEYPAFAVMDIFAQKPVEHFLIKMGGQGQKVDLHSMTDLIDYMENTGWIDVPKKQVPKFLAAALESQQTWVATMGTATLPTFILLPTWVDPDDILREIYPEIDT